MRISRKPGRFKAAAGTVAAVALGLLALPSVPSAQAAESLSVNLASVTGPATGVGEGFLYGISQDGTAAARTSTCSRWASPRSAAAGT